MMSFCVVPASAWSRRAPCSSATATYSASSHIAVALIVIEVFIVAERDAVEQRPHVPQVRHRHADLADLAPGQFVVGVVPGLGRQVEGHRQPGLTLGHVAPVQRVGLGRRGVPAYVRISQGLSRIGQPAAEMPSSP